MRTLDPALDQDRNGTLAFLKPEQHLQKYMTLSFYSQLVLHRPPNMCMFKYM